MSDHRLVLRRLRGLRDLLADGLRGYDQVSDRVRDTHLHQLFGMMASGRIGMVADLEQALRELGGAYREHATLRGTLHRRWIALREALALLNDTGLLGECERGERYIREVYGRYSELPGLPVHVKDLLLRHRAMITANLEEIAFLREARDGRFA